MVFIAHLIYVLYGPKTAKLSRLVFKHKKEVIIIHHRKTFLFLHQVCILEVNIFAHVQFLS